MKSILLVLGTLLVLLVAGQVFRPNQSSKDNQAAQSNSSKLDSHTVRQVTLAGEAETQKIIASVQRHLIKLGYAPGPADGVLGPQTRRAIQWFQQANSLLVNGDATQELMLQLTARGQEISLTELPEPTQPTLAQTPTMGDGPVLVVQRALFALGYLQGPIDGLAGVQTHGAIRAYQRDSDLSADGDISISLMDHLRDQLDGRVSKSVYL